MRFHAAGLCFTDGGGVAFQQDVRLVGLSVLVAVAGAYAALEMIERSRGAHGMRARLWQAASAAALGVSVWSMHFIGMLAIRIEPPVTYAPGIALLSLLIAVGAVAWGLRILHAGASWLRTGAAGIVVGLGVAAMHYVGMAGVRFTGELGYTPGLFSLSVLIGIAAAIVALQLSIAVRSVGARATAALVMGAAICGMHYTGMSATAFLLDPLARRLPSVPSFPLTVALSLTTLGLLLCALVLVAADRRVAASELREAASLRQANERLARGNAVLELSRKQFIAVLNNITQGVCLFDGAERLVLSNRRFTEIYGLPPTAVCPGSTFKDIMNLRYAAGGAPDMSPSEYLAARRRAVAARVPSSTVTSLKNGRVVAINHQPMSDGGWVATHEDITERQQAEANVVFMAKHDALTQLPNRVLFNERLEQALDTTGGATGCALLYIDLDHFKLINDTRGHPIGDGLLQAAAERLRSCAREVDTAARLGGDEFAIIQVQAPSPDDAEGLANRVIAAFREPFIVDGHQILIGTSIGIAMGPGDGGTAERLLNSADIALYLAKTEGRGTLRFFEPEMDARINARRMLELDLRDAVARGEFELHYQPVVNLATGQVTSYEALLRWHHPVRGLVMPADFISSAEETGLIVPIGEWVLRTACLEAENWPANINIAVNMSAAQFKKGDPVSAVRAALDASGLQPNRLELEITETVLLQDTVAALAALHQLRGMGIAIALDDFGTGYSSLRYLRSFPFDKIKIDQSFVHDLVDNKEAMSIVRAVTGLGDSLCMRTTAEGVESVEQLDELRKQGCTEVQGYYFGRPKPANELRILIERPNVGG